MEEKKIVLVTGSSRGIGASICLSFAQAGYNVVLNYFSRQDKADKVRKSVENYNGECLLVKADVSKAGSVEDMFNQVKTKFGRLDVLVNNAGVMANSLLSMMPEDNWDRVVDIHLKGAYLCSKSASRMMIAQRSGVIINISSITAFRPLLGQSNYVAAKAGIIALTKAMAKELSRWKIRVNCIAPGFIQTEIVDALESEETKALMKHIPLGAAGRPEDVAELAVFLASDKAGYITGETIRIDGGLSI